MHKQEFRKGKSRDGLSPSRNLQAQGPETGLISAGGASAPVNGINMLKRFLDNQRAERQSEQDAKQLTAKALHQTVSVPEHRLLNAELSSSMPFPLSADLQSGPGEDGRTLKQIMMDYAGNLLLDVLGETISKLTGLHKFIDIIPLLHLIRDAKRALTAAGTDAREKLLALKLAFNNTRASLKSDENSLEFAAVSGICLILDILHKSLTLRRGEFFHFLELKNAVDDLNNHVPIGALGEAVTLMLESAELWQHWKNSTLTQGEIVMRLAEKIAPAPINHVINIAGKISHSIRKGSIRIEGLPEMPGQDTSGVEQRNAENSRTVVTKIQWLMSVLNHPEIRLLLENTDESTLTTAFGLNNDEIAFLRENLLSYVQTFARFPHNGSESEKLMALMQLTGTSEYINQANIKIAPGLGVLGELVKEDARLSDVFSIYSAKGMRERVSKALSLVNIKATLYKGGNALFNAIFSVLGAAVQPLTLALRKSFEFSHSVYAVGVNHPSMFYEAIKAFLKADYAANKESYRNISIEKLQALVVFCFTSRSVQVSYSATAGEWLEAYARADPDKLTVKDKFIQHAFLEPMVAAEIYRALRDEDVVRARRNLEPLSRAIALWGSESPALRLIATVLPHFPAIKEVWDEMKSLHKKEQVKLHEDLVYQLSIQKGIINGRKSPSAESLASRRRTLDGLQSGLRTLQKQVGYEPSWAETQQAELDVLHNAATASLTGDKLENVAEALRQVQESLDILNSIPSESAVTGRLVHEKLQQSLIEATTGELVSSSDIFYAQLVSMEKMLDALPDESSMTGMESVQHFLLNAAKQLALSKKPGLQSTRSELDAALRNFTSDSLVSFIQWAKEAIASLFIREVELSPEEEKMGMFIIETNPSVSQLVTGAVTGAGVGGLFSLLIFLLSEDGRFSRNKDRNGLALEGPLPESVKGADDNARQAYRTGALHSDVYGATTHALPEKGMEWGAILTILMATIAGGISGMGVAALMDPPTRKKSPKFSADSEQDEAITHLTRPGQLHEITDSEGTKRGIILDAEEEPQYASLTERSVASETEETGTHSRRVRRHVDASSQGVNEITPTDDQAGEKATDLSTEDNVKIAKINDDLQSIQKGALIRLGAELVPEAFIRKYIQDILDAHPEGRGGLTSPDSKLDFRPSTAGPVTKSVKLIDLATGKFDYRKYNPVWEFQGGFGPDNSYLKFRKALLPGASRAMSSDGHNLANKTPGKHLPDVIMEAYEQQLAKITGNPETKAHLEKFYESSFRMTARNLTAVSELAVFSPQFNSIVSGQQLPHRLALRSQSLSEVVAIRHGDKILAWDAGGTWMVIHDNVAGRKNKAMREWVLRHLPANTQFKFKNAGDDVFATVDDISIGPGGGVRIRKASAMSPFRLSVMNNVGADTLDTVIARAKSDINAMVETSGEYLLECLINAAYIATGIGLSALLPGSGVPLMLKTMALSAGLSVTTDLVKVAVADNSETAQKNLEALPFNLVASLIIDGKLTLGLPLAKKLLASGRIKLPWAKEANVVKDVPVGIAANSAASELSRDIESLYSGADETADSTSLSDEEYAKKVQYISEIGGDSFREKVGKKYRDQQALQRVSRKYLSVKNMQITVTRAATLPDVIHELENKYPLEDDFSRKLVDYNQRALRSYDRDTDKKIPAGTVLHFPPLLLSRGGDYYTTGYESFEDIFEQYKMQHKLDNMLKFMQVNPDIVKPRHFDLKATLKPNTLVHLYF